MTVDAARIVLLNDVPDCLLHVTLERLELDTFRDRDGPQIELQCRLCQTKLVRRAPLAPAVALLDVHVSGSISADVRERALCIKKLGVRLKNTKIVISDGELSLTMIKPNQPTYKITGLFAYLLQHPPSAQKLRSSTSSSGQKSKLQALIAASPNVDVQLEDFVVELIAQRRPTTTTASATPNSKTLALRVFKARLDFNAKTRSGSARLSSISIVDHQSRSSRFTCGEFQPKVNLLKTWIIILQPILLSASTEQFDFRAQTMPNPQQRRPQTRVMIATT